MPLRSVLLAAFFGAPLGQLGAHALHAQQREPASSGRDVQVAGRVLDRVSGAALSSVRLLFTSTAPEREGTWQVVTDSVGRFDVGRLSIGSYELRGEAFGFTDLTHRLLLAEGGDTELLIEMVPVALEMDPIVVTATRPAWLAEEGFYERRARALGYSLTRAEIESHNPYLVSDLFYGIPGADVISERTGQTPAFVLLRGRCVPQVVLDGAPFSEPVAIDQVVAVQDLEAVEVYHGSTGPIRYSSSSCGTIMLWTRRAALGQGRPLTWTRFLTAIGIVTWFTISLW